MTTIKFTPFKSQIEPQFWHSLSTLKLDVLKLSSDSIPVQATYGAGRTVVDRETGKEIELGCTFNLRGDGLAPEQFKPTPDVAISKGSLVNFNTVEEIKDSAKKISLFSQVRDEIWDSFETDDPQINRFLLIAFADLKKYQYHYWLAYPAFEPRAQWTVVDPGLTKAEETLGVDAVEGIFDTIPANSTAFLLRRYASGKYESAPLSKYEEFFKDVPSESRLVGFLDPSPSPSAPGWPLKNILAYLYHKHPTIASHKILCWRDTLRPATGSWKSRITTLHVGANAEPGTKPAATGWERTGDKLIRRMVDLGASMDPLQLADQALTLNLKLMRWRILPALNLEKVAQTKCLLLGAGTLGCYVARTLMAWGVGKISLVDYGKVSFSNPVRQPLFELEDCLNGGRPKAEAAAARLKKIFPGVDATGYSISIPMPGHHVPDTLVESTKKDVELLEKLIDEHDVIFLLMDSRESRWLPTVIGAAKNKIVMNAALGFDTFLVMRHGPRSSSYPKEHTGIKLGCYFCNDVVAPADSLKDRTLDQMCTVTRPGLASIASASLVELLVSALQHPKGHYAPSPPVENAKSVPGPTQASLDDENNLPEGTSILGLVPHQIRGYLGQFRNLLITGQQFDRCTGCSEAIIKAYEKDGFSMLLNAFNETEYIEKLTGLDILQKETQEAMEAVDWDGDGEGGGSGEDDF